MERTRRDMLEATAGLATVSMAGLAGCSSIPFIGGGGGDCGTPEEDNMTGALPEEDAGDYSRTGEPETISSEGQTFEERVTAEYRGPQGFPYTYNITRYASPDDVDVEEGLQNIPGESVSDEDVDRRVVVAGSYAYTVETTTGFAGRMDRLAAEAGPLSLSCLSQQADEDGTDALEE